MIRCGGVIPSNSAEARAGKIAIGPKCNYFRGAKCSQKELIKFIKK